MTQNNRTRNRTVAGVGGVLLAAVLFFAVCYDGADGTNGWFAGNNRRRIGTVPAVPVEGTVPEQAAEGSAQRPPSKTAAVAPEAAPAVAPAPAVAAQEPVAENVPVQPGTQPLTPESPQAPVRVPAFPTPPRASGGGRIVLLQQSELFGLYDIASVSYTIDNLATYGVSDDQGVLNSKGPVVMVDTMLSPGPHRIVVNTLIRGATNKAVPYVRGMELRLEKAYHFTAETGTDYQLVTTYVMNKGSTLKYEDKPDLSFSRVALDLTLRADTAAVAAQPEDATTTRLVVVQHNNVRTTYRITGLTYVLDGLTIANRQDESVNLDDQTPLVVFDGRMTPGAHHLSVVYRLRGASNRALSYLKTSGERMSSQFDFTVATGNLVQLTALVSAKEGATLTDSNRPEVTFTTGVVRTGGRVPPPAITAAH